MAPPQQTASVCSFHIFSIQNFAIPTKSSPSDTCPLLSPTLPLLEAVDGPVKLKTSEGGTESLRLIPDSASNIRSSAPLPNILGISLLNRAGIVTLVKFLHHVNAPAPMVFTLLGIVTISSETHRLKASLPMLVTPLGISIFSNGLTEPNAPSSIVVRFRGSLMLFNSELLKAQPSILVTPSCNETLSRSVYINNPNGITVIWLGIFADFIEVRENALAPISLTLSGILILDILQA